MDGLMTPEQFKQIRTNLGLTKTEMAKALRLQSERTIRRIEKGETEITGPVGALMELFESHGSVRCFGCDGY